MRFPVHYAVMSWWWSPIIRFSARMCWASGPLDAKCIADFSSTSFRASPEQILVLKQIVPRQELMMIQDERRSVFLKFPYLVYIVVNENWRNLLVQKVVKMFSSCKFLSLFSSCVGWKKNRNIAINSSSDDIFFWGSVKFHYPFGVQDIFFSEWRLSSQIIRKYT